LLRAQAFKQLGLLHAIHPDQLSVEGLRAAVDLSLTQSRQELLARAQQHLSLDGARRAAAHLLALAARRDGGGEPQPTAAARCIAEAI
jgi:predicted glycosyltransferase